MKCGLFAMKTLIKSAEPDPTLKEGTENNILVRDNSLKNRASDNIR